MIEKLDHIKHTDNLYDKNGFITNVACGGVVISKINELVDTVDELQEMCKSCDNQIGILAEQIAKLQHDNSGKANCQENVQDKFAEQRKWIGKLCRFWSEDKPDELVYSILYSIYPDDVFRYESIYNFYYTHCKPVKPDDDIIYKGADNE